MTRKPPKPTHAPVSFASRQIQGSQNRAAAAFLFSPRTNTAKRGPVPATHYPPPSPTPLRIQSPLKSVLALQSDNSSLGSDSETEDEVRIGLEKINLRSQSSQSGSEAESHAEVHSKQHRAPKPRGGAQDVWKFFEKLSGSERHKCLFCK